MERELKKIFQKEKYEPEPDLCKDIWQRIVTRDERVRILKLLGFSLVGIFSLVGLIPTFKLLSSDLLQSGFYEYFSILFSDSGTLLNYWRELSLSILESLPMTSILLSLSLLFILVLSLKYITKQIIKEKLTLSF